MSRRLLGARKGEGTGEVVSSVGPGARVSGAGDLESWRGGDAAGAARGDEGGEHETAAATREELAAMLVASVPSRAASTRCGALWPRGAKCKGGWAGPRGRRVGGWNMARPVTLFTGQWADLTLEELARKCGEWGFNGLELACWGDHFDVDKALSESGYIERRWEMLRSNGLTCWAISTHLVGQAVCDPIDARHGATLPPDVWGDCYPKACAGFRPRSDTAGPRRFFRYAVNGFTDLALAPAHRSAQRLREIELG